MSGSGQQAGTLSDAQRKWMQAFFGQGGGSSAVPPADGAVARPGGGGDGKPAVAPIPDSLPKSVPHTGMKDEDIAAKIMDFQSAILIGWQSALSVFMTTMSSSADADASPDFQKTLGEFVSQKLMGVLLAKSPFVTDLAAVAGALAGETQRAAAAGASATLRDFVNEHTKAIARLNQAVLTQRQDFISAVREKREAVEPPASGSGKKKSGKWDAAKPSDADNDYAMMRMGLMDTLAAVDSLRKASSSEALFRVLSEEWIRHAQFKGGMGVKFDAMVMIRLDPGYKIMDARIKGTGGQKLAEQLLKESPDGVDVLGLKTKRVISLMAENGWPKAQLTLDANGRDISTGSIAEGQSDALYKYIMSKGLPKTKALTGD